MAITLTLGIIVPLTKGIIYLNAWAIVYYSVTGSPEPLDNNDNSSHAFPIYLNNNRLLLGNSEYKIQNYELVDYYYCCSYHCRNLRRTKLQGWRKGEGFFSGALAGGMGCGSVIFEIFLAVGGLILLFKLFGFLFG